MALDDLLHQGETYPRALVCGTIVQPLKDHENAVVEFRGDANTIKSPPC